MENYHATIDYLQGMGYCGAFGPVSCKYLISNIVNNLKTDGFVLEQIQRTVETQEAHRYLRGLQETVGGINLVDVSLVMMCIIFAGLASGLTQVKLFIFNLHHGFNQFLTTFTCIMKF